MKVTYLIKLPNTGGYRALTGHLLSPMELSSTGMGFHLIELLASGFPWEPSNIPAATKTTSCSPQTYSKAPLSKTTPAQFIGHGEVKLVPT